MATRLYFSRASGVESFRFAPAWQSGWNKGNAALIIKPLFKDVTPHVQNNGNSTATGNGTSGHFVGVERFLSSPLLAQNISGTVKGQFMAQQTNAADNYTLAIAIRVIAPDGTLRGTLLDPSASDNTAATPPELAVGSNVNRQIQDSSENTALSLTALDVTEGDRLFVEIGYRQGSTATASGGVRTGKADGSDLPEDNTATTGDAWIEFTDDITFVPETWHRGSSNNPASGGTANEPGTHAVTPTSSIQTGDLVIMVGQIQVATTGQISIGNNGGQSWTGPAETSGNDQAIAVWWCIFDGTWDANPSLTFAGQSGTQPTSVFLHAFGKPTGYTWAADTALAGATEASGATVTISGITPANDNNLVLAGWFQPNAATYSSLSGSGGTGWYGTEDAQITNIAGSDQTASFAYQQQGTKQATGNVSQNVSANAAGISFTMAWYLIPPASFTPTLNAYRFYDDDADEDDSTPLEAQDKAMRFIDDGSDFGIALRLRVDETAGVSGLSTDDYQLQYRKNGGSWTNVTGSSSNVQSTGSGSPLTDGGATTDRSTNGISNPGAGSFVAGEQEEVNGVIEDHQLTASNYTEHVFALTIIAADVAPTDTLEFRLTLNGGSPGMTNNVVPKIWVDTVVGQASSTSTAQAIAPVITANVVQASSTSTAQPIAPFKYVDVGIASETSAAQAITPERQVSVAISSETDLAQPLAKTHNFLTAVSAASATITIPAAAQADTDVAILFDLAGNLSGGPPAGVTPTGWTQIGTDQTVNNQRARISYKILETGDPGSVVTGMDGFSERKIMAVFRSYIGDLTAVVISSTVNQAISTGDPASQAANASGGNTPLAVIAGMLSDGAISPRTSTPTLEENNGGDNSTWVLYQVYDQGSGVDHTADMGDEGLSNWLSAFWIEFQNAASIEEDVIQASETDTAQAIAAVHEAAVGQASETDSAQIITNYRMVLVSQASEDDASQAIAAIKYVSTTLASETDLAQAVTGEKLVSVVQASESNTAQSIAAVQQVTVTQAEEANTSQAITIRKDASVVQASETDLAQPIVASEPFDIGMAAETDTAQAITSLKYVDVLQATETDLAQTISASEAFDVALATEADLAQLVTATKEVAVVQASEADTGQSITPQLQTAVTQASETDLAQAVGYYWQVLVGQAEEFDAATALEGLTDIPVGQAFETDLAQAVTAQLIATVTQATETDLSQAVAGEKYVNVGQASETDTAQIISSAGATDVLQASETDTSQSVQPIKYVNVQQALETNTAQPVTLQKIIDVIGASEICVAQPISPYLQVQVGRAEETCEALGVALVKFRDVGLATETDEAFEIQASSGALISGFMYGALTINPNYDATLQILLVRELHVDAIDVEPYLTGLLTLSEDP